MDEMLPSCLEADPLAHVMFVPSPTAPKRRVLPWLSGRARLRQPACTCATDPPADGLLRWILARASIPAEAYREQALQRRLAACLRGLRVASVEEALALLQQRPGLLPVAVNTLLLGVSSFFRDATTFESLANRWLSQLAADQRPLRVWSAGCSDGQELYSVAMLLAERSQLVGSDLLGTDCRATAIARARAGVYTTAELAAVSPPRRQRYFAGSGAQAQIVPGVRDAVRWEVADLFATAPAGPWDLILFRNVSIYLKWERALPLWERLVLSLAPGGLLVTGKAERPPGSLPLVRVDHSIYRRADHGSGEQTTSGLHPGRGVGGIS